MQSVKHSSKDRISPLLDPLLYHILSFLQSKYVVQTCLLSKRWKDVWCSVPFLKLSEQLWTHKAHDDFVGFSDGLLFYRDGSNVQSFKVHCSVDLDNVNSWIIVVLRRNVEVIDIEFDCSLGFQSNVDLDKSLELTSRLYTCASLRVLKLKLGDLLLKVPNYVSLPRLEVLHIEDITFEGDGLGRLVSSCPLLQSLIIDTYIFGGHLLDISSPQLETLILRGGVTFINISAPRLVSLEISVEGHADIKPTLSISSMGDFPYLRDANIGMELCSATSLKKFFLAVSKAQSLKFSLEFMECFADIIENEPLVPKWHPGQFDGLKFLDLESCFISGNVFAIYKLLKFCPNIETFVLSNCGTNISDDPADTKAFSECKLYRLKLVKLKYFGGLADEVKLVEFFIKNAENLEKLTITTQYASLYGKVLLEMSNILLTCPRRGKLCLDNSSETPASLSFIFL
ncbi:hypothetical protein ACHQM5_003294 [Ranunculus cassubicifolius]